MPRPPSYAWLSLLISGLRHFRRSLTTDYDFRFIFIRRLAIISFSRPLPLIRVIYLVLLLIQASYFAIMKSARALPLFFAPHFRRH